MRIRIPGDKSISQRGLILSTLASGESRLRGLLAGADPASTAGALRELGASIPPVTEWADPIRVRGLGFQGMRAPKGPLDLENSGTGARLLMGVLAGQRLDVVVTGDESLRSRPMMRITSPLSQMGAGFRFLEAEGRLPVQVRGGDLREMDYVLPVASAQVKSSILLAGLVAGVPVSLEEPGRSRNHTESMLRAAGVSIVCEAAGTGWKVSVTAPPKKIDPLDLEIPGDFSSAAFLLVLGLLAPAGSPLVLEGVGLNPTRAGLLPVLERMGARIPVEALRGQEQGEPLGDLVVEPAELAGTRVEGHEIPGLIDEIPVLAVAASRARGRTVISGAAELRVKETDRIRALVENFRALGVEVEEREDGLEIQGSGAPLEGRVESFGDHRIAMAFGVLGALPGNRIQVLGREVVGVSFPGFWNLLEKVKAR
ncbi:MAG: 3-phosphoshikimate 1-carboxyvinyltransferase [Longimicrobiales bacterium]